MIVAFEHYAKATFTKLLYNFIAICKMLIETTEVLVRVGIETVVCLIVEHAHLRLATSHRQSPLALSLQLLALLDWEEIYRLILEDLSFLDLP